MDASFENPHKPTAPMQAVKDMGIVDIMIPMVADVPGPAVTDAVIVLTTHLRMKGLVIPNILPIVRNIMDFQNLPMESLWKTNGLI